MEYKILIAEDDLDIVELLKMYLLNVGFKVISCNDGESAYNIINSEKIDLTYLEGNIKSSESVNPPYDITKLTQTIFCVSFFLFQ